MNKGPKNNFRYFIYWGAILFPSLLILNTLLFHFCLGGKRDFFLSLAASMVVSWLLMLTLYYVWAIYFYNINRGWTDKDWHDHDEKVQVNPDAAEPEGNPNSEETLGLPPGTVRGTIALTVMVIGLATLVASFGMPGKLMQNEFLIDHAEFLKTAFLMVIAFYFGGKSLESISRNQVLGKSGTNANAETAGTSKNGSGGIVPVTPAGVVSSGQAAADITTGPPSAADFHDPNAKG